MSSILLRVRSVYKRFQGLDVVSDLTLDVRRGEIFALLGPNGAGKTTTIRMILGLIGPDSGQIELESGEGGPFPRSGLGYLPEDRGLYRDIPVAKTLTYMGLLRGLSRGEAARQSRVWLDRVGLGDRAHDKLETLSKGNQQKVQFISAILHEPEFAVLDEPFSGLDPLNQEFFLDVIRELQRNGVTILLCAHQMELVERLADRVLLIDRGREVLSGTLAEVRRNARATERVVLTAREGADLSSLSRSPLVHKSEPAGAGSWIFFVRQGVPLHKFLQEAAQIAELVDVHSQRVSLHDLFVEAVGRPQPQGMGAKPT